VPTLSLTEGGVTSFAADSTETTTVPLVDRRPLESSAKPVIVNVPVVGGERRHPTLGER